MSAAANSHGTVRAARAEALHEHLVRHGCDCLAELYSDLRADDWTGWTRAEIDRAINDLASVGRVQIETHGVIVCVEVVPS